MNAAQQTAAKMGRNAEALASVMLTLTANGEHRRRLELAEAVVDIHGVGFGRLVATTWVARCQERGL